MSPLVSGTGRRSSKERHCETPCCRARKHCAPPTNQRGFDAALQNEDSDSASAKAARQVAVSSISVSPLRLTEQPTVPDPFPASSGFVLLQRSTVRVCSPPPDASVAVQRRVKVSMASWAPCLKESPSATTVEVGWYEPMTFLDRVAST